MDGEFWAGGLIGFLCGIFLIGCLTCGDNHKIEYGKGPVGKANWCFTNAARSPGEEKRFYHTEDDQVSYKISYVNKESMEIESKIFSMDDGWILACSTNERYATLGAHITNTLRSHERK